MLTYPDLDPVLLSIGSLKIHWYGIMYLVGFVAAWWLARYRARTQPARGWKVAEIEDLIFYAALGVILGGRLGYILFYSFDETLADPIRILRIWEGGMAFHGGLLGVMLAMWLYARKTSRRFFAVTDFIAPLVPIGLLTGRIANFINAELWGGPTSLAVGMKVPCERSYELCQRVGVSDVGMSAPVHASQLYEAGLEGALLFLILWFYSAKQSAVMAVSALFLIFYGLFRFSVEFVRMPDAHIGYLFGGWFTMGMLLSLPMIIGGVLLLLVAYKKNMETPSATVS
ncbi:prolipoprotein diacylglyceryl transferase [Solemya velum gill symbiont]|uniref:prolipoprotein diacylglyceryl transferase n=1 Tax=Solemya velum gill symbiont TaxID=2340 RepID=UPI00099621F0|nr:prolipoprotein diacylglyceryl transferase [Solemya velum gill symbiont]OOZ00211.1 prolipoprotein diacylglyceryl transferase [Solemya velum gill symbiont]OOZ02369.1 prolipoprotein diacylglyceryl transferase [Solemya velum gill symbiont]OOZ04726.1 prolipoprotein diacylglyceryl transferase [Solemya velum gill symbiont]OOZ06965.1 prolipoprotein diacylglyceryl transferase [Solemya velum gill symbiont]OOZ09148.1 prolipoprotein diacylglyceryl transferase [Solemya velum gill symbiont]